MLLYLQRVGATERDLKAQEQVTESLLGTHPPFTLITELCFHLQEFAEKVTSFGDATTTIQRWTLERIPILEAGKEGSLGDSKEPGEGANEIMQVSNVKPIPNF